MAEELKLPETGERGELYDALQPQIAALIESEDDLVANLANTAAVLHTALQTLWTGFYRVKSDALVQGGTSKRVRRFQCEHEGNELNDGRWGVGTRQ